MRPLLIFPSNQLKASPRSMRAKNNNVQHAGVSSVNVSLSSSCQFKAQRSTHPERLPGKCRQIAIIHAPSQVCHFSEDPQNGATGSSWFPFATHKNGVPSKKDTPKEANRNEAASSFTSTSPPLHVKDSRDMLKGLLSTA